MFSGKRNNAASVSVSSEAYIAVLYAAIRKHGCPAALVSDHGGVFRDHRAMHIYRALGIEKLAKSDRNGVVCAKTDGRLVFRDSEELGRPCGGA